jgi:hypothetical protein
VAGAEVFLYRTADTRRSGDFVSPRTGGDGAYRLVVPPGAYWAVARVRSGERPGPVSSGDRHSGLPESIEGVAGLERTLDLVVASLVEAAESMRKTRPDIVTIEGRVVSGSSPLAGRYMAAAPCGTRPAIPPFLSAWTGPDGRFRLFVSKGCHDLALATTFPPADLRVVRPGLEVTGDVHALEVADEPTR